MPQTRHCIVGRSQHRDPGQIKCEGDIVETSKSKPVLLEAVSRPTESKRILAQLEHGTQTHHTGWTVDGWTVALFVLLLSMCGVAWLMHDGSVTPQRNKHSYSTQVRAVTPTLAPADGEPQPEQAATIINVASADSGDVPTTAAAPARAPATPAKPVQPVARVAAVPHAAAQPADSDVTLLTALVAHAGKPSEVTPERNRDVVERQDSDSTAQLLARCKQLGLIEGMLCRSRICSGRWEADAACRAPSR